MSAAQVLYTEEHDDSFGDSGTGYVEIASIPAASFTASKKYLILAFVLMEHESATQDGKVRLVHGTTPTVFSEGEAVIGVQSGASGWCFQFAYVWDQPGTAETIALQATSSGTGNFIARMAQIIAIKLSDDFTENTDWWYNEVTADYTTTTTMTAQASVTILDSAINGTDTFLAIGWGICRNPDTTTQDVIMRLSESGSGAVTPRREFIGENTATEKNATVLMRPFVLTDGANRTISADFGHESGISAAGTVFESHLFVIRLNKFAQFVTDYQDGNSSALTTSFATVAGVDPTPSVTGNWVVLGQMVFDPGASTDAPAIRLQLNPSGGGLASDPNYGDDEPGVVARDVSDEPVFVLGTVASLSSGAAREINLDAKDTVGTTAVVRNRCLVAFSAELAAAGGAFSIDAQPGSYTLTGIEAGVVSARLIDAQPGSYVLTGFQAGVLAGRVVDAQPGSYAVTGAAAGLLADRVLNAQPGSYVLTGAEAQLIYSAAVAVARFRTLMGLGT